MVRIRNTQDFWAGLLFAAFGVAALIIGRDYAFGTATRMGPGYLPMLLSGGLVLIGSLLMLRGLSFAGPPLERSDPRPQFFILAAIVAFALLIERAGLVVAVMVAALLASLASREIRWRETVVVAAVLAAGMALLFVKALGQAMPIWWF
jgi:putative tricarboxylic transport membrane protein